MKKILFTILFLTSLTALSAQLQDSFLLVGSAGTFSALTDSTFRGTVTFQSDQFGSGYLPTGIQTNYKLIDAKGDIFTITAVNSSNFTTANIDVEEDDADRTAPAGIVMVFKVLDSGLYPLPPVNSTGASPIMQARLLTDNAIMSAANDNRLDSISQSGRTFTFNVGDSTYSMNSIDTFYLENGIYKIVVGGDTLTAEISSSLGRTWYVDLQDGNDSNCAVGDIFKPCKDIWKTTTKATDGDIIEVFGKGRFFLDASFTDIVSQGLPQDVFGTVDTVVSDLSPFSLPDSMQLFQNKNLTYIFNDKVTIIAEYRWPLSRTVSSNNYYRKILGGNLSLLVGTNAYNDSNNRDAVYQFELDTVFTVDPILIRSNASEFNFSFNKIIKLPYQLDIGGDSTKVSIEVDNSPHGISLNTNGQDATFRYYGGVIDTSYGVFVQPRTGVALDYKVDYTKVVRGFFDEGPNDAGIIVLGYTSDGFNDGQRLSVTHKYAESINVPAISSNTRFGSEFGDNTLRSDTEIFLSFGNATFERDLSYRDSSISFFDFSRSDNSLKKPAVNVFIDGYINLNDNPFATPGIFDTLTLNNAIIKGDSIFFQRETQPGFDIGQVNMYVNMNNSMLNFPNEVFANASVLDSSVNISAINSQLIFDSLDFTRINTFYKPNLPISEALKYGNYTIDQNTSSLRLDTLNQFVAVTENSQALNSLNGNITLTAASGDITLNGSTSGEIKLQGDSLDFPVNATALNDGLVGVVVENDAGELRVTPRLLPQFDTVNVSTANDTIDIDFAFDQTVVVNMNSAPATVDFVVQNPVKGSTLTLVFTSVGSSHTFNFGHTDIQLATKTGWTIDGSSAKVYVLRYNIDGGGDWIIVRDE